MRGSAGPGAAAGAGEGDDAVMGDGGEPGQRAPLGATNGWAAARATEPAIEPVWPADPGGRVYRLWAGVDASGEPFYGAAVVGLRTDDGEGPTAEDLAGKLEDAVVAAHDALTGALARIEQDRLLRPAGWSVCGED